MKHLLKTFPFVGKVSYKFQVVILFNSHKCEQKLMGTRQTFRCIAFTGLDLLLEKIGGDEIGSIIGFLFFKNHPSDGFCAIVNVCKSTIIDNSNPFIHRLNVLVDLVEDHIIMINSAGHLTMSI